MTCGYRLMGVAMDEVTTSPLAAVIPQLGTSFVQASSDATRRLCEQGESFAKTVREWNTEVSHFVTFRATRNAEAMTRIAKCQSFQTSSLSNHNGCRTRRTTI